MRYPQRFKDLQVRLVRDHEVYYHDVFECRDVFVGEVYSSPLQGARSPGGMVTNVVWTAITPDDKASGGFASKVQAIDHLLQQAHEARAW